MDMRTSKVLTDLHPKSLLYRDGATIEEFDSREDLMEYLKAHPRAEYNLDKFFSNVKNYEVDERKVEEIRNTVRNNLLKRGIITGSVYEGYKYDIEGEIVDYAELSTGNPKCMMTPVKKYDKYFYELYCNMSIPWSVSESRIIDGAIRLAETIKALEELKVEIKVNIVLYSQGMYTHGGDYLFILPLLSHLEYKDHKVLLPYLDGEFLRSALFTVMKNSGDTKDSLGSATKLENTVNLWSLKEEDSCREDHRRTRDLICI